MQTLLHEQSDLSLHWLLRGFCPLQSVAETFSHFFSESVRIFTLVIKFYLSTLGLQHKPYNKLSLISKTHCLHQNLPVLFCYFKVLLFTKFSPMISWDQFLQASFSISNMSHFINVLSNSSFYTFLLNTMFGPFPISHLHKFIK